MHETPLIPEPARPGDLIYVAQVAGRVDPRDLDVGVARLREAGFRVRLDPTLGQGAPYLAAHDALRAADLVRAIEADGVSAVICARGGYGAMRLLDALPPDLLRRHPRWLVGYSDITALHLWAERQGVATLHGPMVVGLQRYATPDTFAALVDALAGRAAPELGRLTTLRGGRARGVLTGGNLSLSAALIGTRYLPDLRGKILLIEEVGEPPYRVDRMLTTLRIDRRAEGLAGVVIGQLTRCGSAAERALVLEACVELAAHAGCPAVAGLPVGHDDPNLTIRLGVPVTLDADAGRLTWT